MDESSTIQFPSFESNGTDPVKSESEVSTNGFNGGITAILTPTMSSNGSDEKPKVCPNCAELQRKPTNDSNNQIDSSKEDTAPPGLFAPVSFESHSNGIILETILVDNIQAPHTGTIKIIQLRRPNTKNALSRQMVRELGNEIEEIHRQTYDNSTSCTRALIITSAIDNVFCSGADLKERATMSLSETKVFLSSLRSLLQQLSTLPVPSIACVSGVALGGGLELALACNLRVFASNAAVALPETRLAIIPGAGGTYRLPQLVGTSRAMDMILTGRRVYADEAYTMGLCNRLVLAAEREVGSKLEGETQRLEALDASIALATQISMGGPAAVRVALHVLRGGPDALENAAYEAVLGTEDRNEALQAIAFKSKSQIFPARVSNSTLNFALSLPAGG
ncbi:putative enoyl-CoA hydratase [Lachnellula suecica]|uniref:Putative enoyl-CoA hydratase n=1 Tax=Lachnellula suecica TaxID=602035 RepID=A0A8T9C9G6_9HELO|nr:putative enoyl-CoA hydratase [Lachnellula suecica]